jgi:GNAT superfamily N-acetyltransferase
MNVIIRAARIDDILAMHRIRLSVQENRLSEPARVTEKSYLPYVRQGSAWVAEVAGEIAGFAALHSASGSVWALFVDPEMEKIGVGKALHNRMLEWAAEQGLTQISLSTSPGTRAERFYSAAGWSKEGLTSTGEVRFRRTLDPG